MVCLWEKLISLPPHIRLASSESLIEFNGETSRKDQFKHSQARRHPRIHQVHNASSNLQKGYTPNFSSQLVSISQPKGRWQLPCLLTKIKPTMTLDLPVTSMCMHASAPENALRGGATCHGWEIRCSPPW